LSILSFWGAIKRPPRWSEPLASCCNAIKYNTCPNNIEPNTIMCNNPNNKPLNDVWPNASFSRWNLQSHTTFAQMFNVSPLLLLCSNTKMLKQHL
jgi:hypothetical protein